MTTIEKLAVLFEERLEPSSSWSHVLKRGTTLRIVDLEGDANVAALFFNADNPTERYNMPDTLKGQHTFFLERGRGLHSDMGRVLLSITDENCGWHDTVCGPSTAETITASFGAGTYQDLRNDYHRNALDSFLCELEKHGLGPRDLMANVNFFSKVVADEAGGLTLIPGHSTAGSFVDLRAEMNTLVVLNSCPHPLAAPGAYPRCPVQLSVRRNPMPGAEDRCRTSSPENGRAFRNTEKYFL